MSFNEGSLGSSEVERSSIACPSEADKGRVEV